MSKSQYLSLLTDIFQMHPVKFDQCVLEVIKKTQKSNHGWFKEKDIDSISSDINMTIAQSLIFLNIKSAPQYHQKYVDENKEIEYSVMNIEKNVGKSIIRLLDNNAIYWKKNDNPSVALRVVSN